VSELWKSIYTIKLFVGHSLFSNIPPKSRTLGHRPVASRKPLRFTVKCYAVS
jgi:hypothetical protein